MLIIFLMISLGGVIWAMWAGARYVLSPKVVYRQWSDWYARLMGL